jgi:hypothetical protein
MSISEEESSETGSATAESLGQQATAVRLASPTLHRKLAAIPWRSYREGLMLCPDVSTRPLRAGACR